MSSSAFTPTQTQITNNVPTNVPIVEALLDAVTPAGGWFLTGPTNATTTVKQARIGTEAHLKYGINATGTSAAFSELSIKLPANLTVDTTAINKTSTGRAPVGKFELTKPGVGNFTGVVYLEGSAFVCRYLGSTAIPSAVANNSPLNWDITTAATSINIDILVPIAEWAGSGTTTLATRAVEEYAFNTNTTYSTLSDASSFGYGVSGALIPQSALTANVTRDIQFTTSWLPTDRVIIEIDTAGVGQWIELVSNTGGVQSLISGLTNDYGIGNITSIGSNKARITFGRYRRPAGTWDGAGADYSSSSTKYRIKKVSGGAAVGYPVSARNIIGDTSGTVVPTGMIGEELISTSGSAVALTNNTFATIASITLTPGSWDISAFGTWQNTATQATGNQTMNMAISTAAASSTGSTSGLNYAELYGISAKSGYAGITLSIPPHRVIVSSNTQRFLCIRFYADAAGSGNQAIGTIRATRIA